MAMTSRESETFSRLLGVDAEPAVVVDPIEPGALGLVVGELAEVVAEPLDARAVEPGPEGGLGHGLAPGQGHPLVVVGGPADHVDVRVDVVHGPRLLGIE